MSITRDYFPGNNTPEGFFSYYKYILSQEEADKILCIKGGPGTGKSTFIRKIGEGMVDFGRDVDFLHCSADDNSLDGIVIDKHIALIDGTSPHSVDPITPGAIDSIIDFGVYWKEEEIKKYKNRIMHYSNKSSSWYKIAYNYLNAAKQIYNSMTYIVNKGVQVSDINRISKVIIDKELSNQTYPINCGKMKKFFATAITPTGIISHLKTLISQVNKIYFINCPEGFNNYIFMNKIIEECVQQGIDVEVYYCSINPQLKIEHVIIPKLSIALTTCNKWHDIEPWELYKEGDDEYDMVMIDMNDYISDSYKEKNNELVKKLSKEYSTLIYEGINALSKAKENHDIVEEIYIKTMDFTKIDKLALEYIEKLK